MLSYLTSRRWHRFINHYKVPLGSGPPRAAKSLPYLYGGLSWHFPPLPASAKLQWLHAKAVEQLGHNIFAIAQCRTLQKQRHA